MYKSLLTRLESWQSCKEEREKSIHPSIAADQAPKQERPVRTNIIHFEQIRASRGGQRMKRKARTDLKLSLTCINEKFSI